MYGASFGIFRTMIEFQIEQTDLQPVLLSGSQ